VTVGEESIGQMAAKEPGNARDEDTLFLHAEPTSR